MTRAMHTIFDVVEWNEPPTFLFAIDKEVLKRLQGGDIVKALDIFNYSSLSLESGKISVRFPAENGKEQEINIFITAWHPQGHTPY
jgi:hypothetical protein